MTDITTLAILGASGDLTSRLLLPALGALLADEPHRRVRLLGSGRHDFSDAKWRKMVRDAFRTADDDSETDAAMSAVESTAWVTADITTAGGIRDVIAAAGEGRLVLYFAVPPAIAEKACSHLGPDDLPKGTVLVLEKPFGDDEDSARSLNGVLRALVPENQIFRVDHFLGRSTVLNVLGVRFANRLFEPVWSAEHIESVEIRFDESLGLEDRAGYYDEAGALIDMIQSHLLQVLAIVAMEPPATLDEVDFREATTAVLRATHIWDDNAVRSSRRARYIRGEAGGKALGDYAAEPGVDRKRETETLAEMTCEVRTTRWTGVPFTLRSGKALGHATDEIVVRFRRVRHLPTGLLGSADGAVLHFSLGHTDRMSLELNVNGGENPFELRRATLGADLGMGAARAYTEVLTAVLDGDAALSVRGDAAEQGWRIVRPVLDAWRRGDVPLDEYAAGSDGPAGWHREP